ncbi:MAG: hypothetical protein H0U84_04035, partial [Thermoleophilaceae bacterium]|nr:hypothetical protein [Thermoleophilaceae bacterium]
MDERTTLTVLVQHTNKEDRDAHINSGMEAGRQEGMDLLEQVAVSLAEQAFAPRTTGTSAPV